MPISKVVPHVPVRNACHLYHFVVEMSQILLRGHKEKVGVTIKVKAIEIERPLKSLLDVSTKNSTTTFPATRDILPR